MAGARSHEELITWRLAHELKLEIYALLSQGPIKRHTRLCDQLERSAANAPRNIAEGFGRYLPNDFIRYLRIANGEFKETFDSLQDAYDRGCISAEELLRLQRLCKRASKAATNFIKYLRTANPPNEPRPHRRVNVGAPKKPQPSEPNRTPRTQPSAPKAPPEPSEPTG
jgi:four helix bundle protein